MIKVPTADTATATKEAHKTTGVPTTPVAPTITEVPKTITATPTTTAKDMNCAAIAKASVCTQNHCGCGPFEKTTDNNDVYLCRACEEVTNPGVCNSGYNSGCEKQIQSCDPDAIWRFPARRSSRDHNPPKEYYIVILRCALLGAYALDAQPVCLAGEVHRVLGAVVMVPSSDVAGALWLWLWLSRGCGVAGALRLWPCPWLRLWLAGCVAVVVAVAL